MEEINNFTPRAQQVLALARKAAYNLKHGHVEIAHLLLGLLKLDQGVACSVLHKHGIDLEELQKVIGEQNPPGTSHHSQPWNIPYAPHLKKILQAATKEAKAINLSFVGTEALLLAMLHDTEQKIGEILREKFRVKPDDVRHEVLRQLDPTYVGEDPVAAVLINKKQ